MTLQSGKMYRPTDVTFDIGNDTVYVVEQFNHRISKWNYTAGSFDFTIDAGQVTTLSLDNVGSGYVAPTLVFSAPDLDIANPVTATGTIGQTAGNLDSLLLTDGGNGYSVAPTVTVVDSAGINGAVSVSAINAPWGNNGDGTTGQAGPIGAGDSTDNNLYRPSGIVFDVTNTLLYVTDTFHNRVRVITPSTGAFTTSIGTGGSGTSDFYRPAGIAIATALDDVVVIADELNQRAVRYTTNGSTLVTPSVLTDPSVTTGLSFVRPHGVVYDVTDDSFNIGDSLRSKISAYTKSGTFVNQYGTPGSTVDNVNLFYPSSGKGVLTGTGGPATIFADTRNNALKTMNNETIALTTGTTDGTGNGELYWPESVVAAVDTSQYVLAANTYNNRVEIFSSAVAVLTSQSPFNFGSP